MDPKTPTQPEAINMDPKTPTQPEAIRAAVRESYGAIARSAQSCCGGEPGCGDQAPAQTSTERLGYSRSELDAVPEGADLGLGCGNPTALAALQPGEVVVDLGAGAGLDALIAAPKVGPEGRVIGVDMTPEMLERARTHAVEAGYARTVEFREGLIEALPVVSESADVVISNCVINLSPDKPQAFREAFRVLKPGGRLCVSDIVLSEPLPEAVRGMVTAYVACLAGAAVADDYLGAIREAGFVDVRVTRVPAASLLVGDASDPVLREAIALFGTERVQAIADTVWSYKVEARKP